MAAGALHRSHRRPFRRALAHAGDDRLVAALRAGDEAAFETIYDRYHQQLLGFCRHMLGSREEAEDVLQHVFVAAHDGIRADDRGIALKPWLYRIARNRCISVLRTRPSTAAVYDLGALPAAGPAVAESVERREELEAVLEDLADLPEEQRAALLLWELDALSHEQIAEVLDVRRDKVKALVFQARRSLMSAREARAADCAEIQEQLATLRGGSLRRTKLARHVARCPQCAAFKDEVRRQRTELALILPVAPGLLLKGSTLAAIVGGGTGGASGGAVAGGAVAGGGMASGSAVIAKGLAVVALAGGAGGGTIAVTHGGGGSAPRQPATSRVVPERAAQRAASTQFAPAPASAPTTPRARQADAAAARAALGSEHGAGIGHKRNLAADANARRDPIKPQARRRAAARRGGGNAGHTKPTPPARAAHGRNAADGSNQAAADHAQAKQPPVVDKDNAGTERRQRPGAPAAADPDAADTSSTE